MAFGSAIAEQLILISDFSIGVNESVIMDVEIGLSRKKGDLSALNHSNT